jgi:hypothetical protein
MPFPTSKTRTPSKVLPPAQPWSGLEELGLFPVQFKAYTADRREFVFVGDARHPEPGVADVHIKLRQEFNYEGKHLKPGDWLHWPTDSVKWLD